VICVDTNVLVYATVDAAPRHARAWATIDRVRGSERLLMTGQILREYLVVTTHPRFVPGPLSLAAALAGIDSFLTSMSLLAESGASARLALDLIRRHNIVGPAIHDANIAATILANGVKRIVTDNGADFRRFAPDIEVVDLA
jgi:predicted nucleic acid-binding protein